MKRLSDEYIKGVRTSAEIQLKRVLTDSEFYHALVKAQAKLDDLIRESGTIHGTRLQPWYLALLVVEEAGKST